MKLERSRGRGRNAARRSPGAGGLLAAWVLGVAVALCPTMLAAAPADQDVFEDFEGLSTAYGVPFEIGPSGSRAEFGGNARSSNVGSIRAFSGTYAWTVRNAAGIGTITFLDAPASVVEFYASAGTNPDVMTIEAYDPDDVLIGSPIDLSGSSWVLVSFPGPVGRIEVTNRAAGDVVYVDDFGYSTEAGSAVVPLLGLPGIAVLVGALALSGWRRRG